MIPLNPILAPDTVQLNSSYLGFKIQYVLKSMYRIDTGSDTVWILIQVEYRLRSRYHKYIDLDSYSSIIANSAIDTL